MTPEQHFEHLRELWFNYFKETRVYLENIDGTTSRKIGQIVYNLLEDNKKGCELNWVDVETARFLKTDTVLWHELADSRKK